MAHHRIKNVYYMLAYAFQALRAGEFADITTEDFDTLHNLFAEILIGGVTDQIKRGLHRDYVPREESLAGVRGQIRLSESIKRQTLIKGQLVCAYDEFSSDSPHNQALKSVMRLLLWHGDVSADRKRRLRRLLAFLDDVTDVEPSAIRWDTLRYHRNNATYRMLLGICRLIVEGLLQTTTAGPHRLRNWLNDETMAALYERFVRAYYQRHHDAWSPRARYIDWDLAPGDTPPFVPQMKTDVTMEWHGRTLIIDTKWYGHTMQRSYRADHDTFISGNLYQIYTYVKNADRERTGNVSGVLLYAKTDETVTPDTDLVIGGNPIRLTTLDLDQDWDGIVAQLESLGAWLSAT